LLQIALVPLEEFAAHPLAVAGKLAEEGDPHKLMLNRLSHEVAYRCGAGGRRLGKQAAGVGMQGVLQQLVGGWVVHTDSDLGWCIWGRQLEHDRLTKGN
jgi:hypothetical protein